MAAPYVQQQSFLSPGPVTPWGPPSLLQQTPGTGVMIPSGGSRGGGIINAPQVFSPTSAGYRAKQFFAVPHPSTGNLTWYRSAGKPILWSGDLRACKRVNKVASRARRATPRRTAAKRRR